MVLVCSEAGGAPRDGRWPEARWDLAAGTHGAQNQALLPFLHRQAQHTWETTEKLVCYRVVWWKHYSCHSNISSPLGDRLAVVSGCAEPLWWTRGLQAKFSVSWVKCVFRNEHLGLAQAEPRKCDMTCPGLQVCRVEGRQGPESLSPHCHSLRKK